MTTKPSQPEKFPPRGYVDREEWEAAYQKSDPGDFWRRVRVNFIPHRTEQLPDLIPVMSVAEASALADAKAAEAVAKAKSKLLLNLCRHANIYWGDDVAAYLMELKKEVDSEALQPGKVEE